MHKRDKVARLLLTADKVNSFLLKSQISSRCLRRSSAFVLLFVACVIALCTLNGHFGAGALAETVTRRDGVVSDH